MLLPIWLIVNQYSHKSISMYMYQLWHYKSWKKIKKEKFPFWWYIRSQNFHIPENMKKLILIINRKLNFWYSTYKEIRCAYVHHN